MASTTIPWGDGSGDNIYLTYPSASGDQTVNVSSDANTGAARTKVVTFTSGVGNIQRQLTINQDAGLPYTPLNYIQCDGTAYINTKIKGTTPRSAEIKVTPKVASSGNSYMLGCRKDSGNTRFTLLLFSSSKYAGLAYRSGTYTSAVDVSASVNNGTPMEVRTSIKSGTQKIEVKQQGESTFSSYTASLSGSVTGGVDIYLFAVNNYGTAAGIMPSGTRCYGCKIYSDGNFANLVFDGIPVLYNGEYGLWDLVSNSFFGNVAGSGAFTGA